MADPRYTAPVGGKPAALLAPELQAAMAELEQRFPGLGVTLFVFDFSPGNGLSYISNAQRDDMVRVVLEWVRKQRERAN